MGLGVRIVTQAGSSGVIAEQNQSTEQAPSREYSQEARGMLS